EQATDAVGPFENGDGVADFIQLRRGAQAGRAGTDHGDFFASADSRRFRLDPAFFPAAVNNGALKVFDRDWRRVYTENAGSFAGSRTYPPSELGKVIGFVQAFESFLP